jgi:hypothetical protein
MTVFLIKSYSSCIYFCFWMNELLLKRYKDTAIHSGSKTLIGERPKVPDECW